MNPDKFLSRSITECKNDNGIKLSSILYSILFLIFIVLGVATLAYNSTRVSCESGAEAMNLKWELKSGKCVYILPDGVHVLPENYMVVMYSNPIDTDMDE